MRIPGWFLFVRSAGAGFSAAEIRRIDSVVRGVLPVRDAIRAAFLRHDARLAAAKGFQATALAKAVELAGFAPEMAARLETEPAFAAMRVHLERALARLIPAVRVTAQQRIAAATRRLEEVAPTQSARSGAVTARVLWHAQWFFAAGTHAGYVRSAALAEILIHHYGLASAVLSFRKEAEVR